MSYHKTPTPTPKQDNIHYMMMSSVSRMISCEIRDITLNGKDEDIVRAFRDILRWRGETLLLVLAYIGETCVRLNRESSRTDDCLLRR